MSPMLKYEVIHKTPEDKRLYDLYHSRFYYDDGFLRWKIHPHRKGVINGLAGSDTPDGYRIVWTGERYERMHRVIYHMFHGHCPKYIDHKDRDRYNSRIENLRETTSKQNNMNMSKTKCKTYSKYKGVSFNKNKGYWTGAIMLDGKSIHLGYFPSEIGAAYAYNLAALKHFGGRSCINEIDDIEYAKSEYGKKLQKAASSRHRYVYKVPKQGNYGAKVRGVYIGRFDTEDDAARAVNAYIIENELDIELNEV